MSRLDRRSFVKRAAVASATVAGASALPTELTAVALPNDSTAENGRSWHRAPCRMCGVGCGLLVAIEGGRAVAVKGDPDSPVSAGLACAKGYYSIQALYSRDRITRALVRREGALVSVSMREALDLVARKFGESIARHGKDSVAMYGSAQWSVTDAYVAAKFMKAALGTNNIDTNARLQTGSATAAVRSSYGFDGTVGSFDDIEHADVFVLWNANLAESDPVLFSRMLARKRINPAVRIVELATRTSRTSYAADRSLLYVPHSELAIANAVCQEIVVRGWMDQSFIDRYTQCKRGPTSIGLDPPNAGTTAEDGAEVTWKQYVDFLGAYTPERAQQLAGVAAEDIRWLASLYGSRSLAVMTVWGSAVNAQARGTWLNNAIHNIHLVSGKVATPGNAALCVSGQPASGAPHLAGAAPDSLPGGTVTSEGDRRRSAQVWGVPVERLDARAGRNALSIFRGLETGDVRCLWIQATNPLMSLPNLARVRRATEGGGDRFIVVSEVYPTPTTAIADVVLPAALWFEREGIFVSAERRVQHFDRLVQPPGEAMTDSWQIIEVARRLGHAPLFPWDETHHVEQAWDEYRRFLTDRGQNVPRLAELRIRSGQIWPESEGRETKWRGNTALDPAADKKRGAYDFYGSLDHRAHIWLRPYQAPPESPDREYPFWLITGEVLEHWGTGTLTTRIPMLRRSVPNAYVEVSSDDARRLGIVNGERVRLVSRRGSLVLTARVDMRGQPPRGVLFVPVFDASTLVNVLTLDVCCPISGQPVNGCAVRLQRLTAGGDA